MELSELCGQIAPLLGVPATELAEVRRRLREQSENPELTGKPGREGALVATPFNTGFTLVGVMVDSSSGRVAESTWSVFHFNKEGSVPSGWAGDSKTKPARCPLTGEHLFGEAFKALLSNPELAKSVQSVRISGENAEIRYLARSGSSAVSRFGGRSRDARLLRRVAELDGRVVRMTAALLNPPL